MLVPLRKAKPERVLVAQLGARRHYAVPRALHQAGALEGLVTDICADAMPWRGVKTLVPNALQPPPLKAILGRQTIDIPPGKIRNLTSFALSPALRRRRNERQTEYWARRNAAFGRRVAQAGFGGADAVYAFNGAALEIFAAARASGLETVLDQTAAPWRWNRELLVQEQALWPGWEDGPAESDDTSCLAAREEAEWALADVIVTGSDFARRALADTGGPAERVAVVPYPCPPAPGRLTPEQQPPASFSRQRKFRVLFAGTLQLRKGVQYLYEAAGLLAREPVEFRAVGPSNLSARALTKLSERLTIAGRVPRAEMAQHYAWADVFVLPTLSEGSANVCYEALAAGLPVITTPNAGSVISDGEDGLMVPAKEAHALAEAIETLKSNPDLRARFRARAVGVLGRHTLGSYSAGLRHAVLGNSKGQQCRCSQK